MQTSLKLVLDKIRPQVLHAARASVHEEARVQDFLERYEASVKAQFDGSEEGLEDRLLRALQQLAKSARRTR